jgi:hypothetical protein
MNSQVIATHLNILDSAIIEVQEWASVLWVKFAGGVRFVSKKIGATEMTEERAWDLRSAIAELAFEVGATEIDYGANEAGLIAQLEKLQDLATKNFAAKQWKKERSY